MDSIPIDSRECELLPDDRTGLDLVCNQWHARERKTWMQRLAPGSLATGASAGLTRVAVDLLICGAVLAAGALCVALGAFVGTYLFTLNPPFILVWLLLLLVLIGYVPFEVGRQVLPIVAEFPTNLIVSPQGLGFAWRSAKAFESGLVPWSTVRSLSLEGYGKSADPLAGTNLRLSIDLSTLPVLFKALLVLRTRALWSGGQPFTVRATGLDWSWLRLSFPLDALTLDSDRFRLLLACKAWAAEGTMGDSILFAAKANSVPSYTQLWLDDMQSFRRQRVRELAENTLLCNDRYRITARIGAGGQARIYGGMDLLTGEKVALKELVLPTSAGADVRDRSFKSVKNEAMLLARLDHEGIVKLLDHFVEDHRAYLVLEHLEGTTLRDLVHERGPLPARRAAEIGLQVCDLLAYLHGQTPPVVHRDLAPDNLMETAGGRIRLLDFNVAQQLESATTKTTVGKHNYMAPEQFKGRPCPQSDLYSLGATLAFLLTGNDPLPLSSAHPAEQTPVPASLDAIVSKLTRLELSERYASAEAAAEDLRSFATISME